MLCSLAMLNKKYIAAVVQVSAHVPYESSINYLEAGVVFSQTEHVAAKVELLLSHISSSLTDDLANIFSHYTVLSCEVSDKQSKPIDFGRGNINVVRGLSDCKIVFFFGYTLQSLKILLYVVKCDKRHGFRLY